MEKVGIVGAGAMGAGIAQVAAAAGHEVFIYDTRHEALSAAQQRFTATYEKLVAKEKLTEEEAQSQLSRLHFESSLDAFAGIDLVIEAIVEHLEMKKALFEQLERIVSNTCLLATNTSSLSVTSIASACRDTGRVLGLHFFNPPPLMQLVEVIPAVQTSPETIACAVDLMHHWQKLPVVAKDTPGFIVNRIARPFYGEAIRMLEEGMANIATIDWAMTELGGFRMGPFALMDFIGHDVNFAVTESVFQAFFFDPRYKPSFSQKRLVEAGFFGKKTGRGFYDYSSNARQPESVKDESLGKAIVWRIVVMLINEAADALFLGIASAADIETAMTKGVNYPKGLLQWANEKGIAQCVETLDSLYDEYREDRYRCSPLLRRIARAGRLFDLS